MGLGPDQPIQGITPHTTSRSPPIQKGACAAAIPVRLASGCGSERRGRPRSRRTPALKASEITTSCCTTTRRMPTAR